MITTDVEYRSISLYLLYFIYLCGLESSAKIKTATWGTQKENMLCRCRHRLPIKYSRSTSGHSQNSAVSSAAIKCD